MSQDNQIRLSDHFTTGRLLRFTFPSIVMMIFTSIYGVVDGLFVSNYAGKTAFAAVNFIMPCIMILGTFGCIFGTGGGALVGRYLGEGNKDKANALFSLFVYLSLGIGAAVAVLGILILPIIASLLGAEGEMLDNCVLYGRIVLCALPMQMLQMEFQTFFITAERPQLGLLSTVVAGVTNMVGDAVIVGLLSGGVAGAAIATALSQTIGGMIPLLYFFLDHTSILHLGMTRYDGKAVLKACVNGSSELMSNISMSLVGMLYNVQLLKYAGENGVAAYGVLMYVNFVFIAIFIGYTIGTAPVVSFHFGAQDHAELKNLLLHSLGILFFFSLCMFIIAEVAGAPLSGIFVGYDDELMEMTSHAFTIFAFSFLFADIAIYGSSFFTALNDGITSAIISFLRTLVFQLGAILILPLIFDLEGIWWSIVVAEFAACTLSLVFIFAKRNKFHYL